MSIVKIVPNLLCIFRILSAFVSVFFLLREYKILTIVIVALGDISDFFDGYIARKYDAVSKVGALLDPLADKIFANMVLWGTWFVHRNIILFIVSLLLTIRDAGLIVGSLFVIGKKVPLNPMFISKVCTTVVFLYIVLCLIFSPGKQYVMYAGMLSICLILVTAIAYLIRYIKARKRYDDKS